MLTATENLSSDKMATKPRDPEYFGKKRNNISEINICGIQRYLREKIKIA